ncbi:MAG: DUF547 domain-containing protein [Spirochaetota bacterium]|nr:DUF547 domain-containing protein [Spirochaetota bacterium]
MINLKWIKRFAFSISVLLSLFFVNNSHSFNHSTFDGLLRANVKNGLVNYKGFANNKFYNYIESLANAKVTTLNNRAKLAFYINAYNAICIKQVLDNYNSIKDHPKGVSKDSTFFDVKKYKISGKIISLNELENKIIRPTFREPLIHFGLVCAAKGCPPLQSRAYTQTNVMSLLNNNANKYLRSTAGLRVADAKKVIYISKIFQWYKVDFNDNSEDKENYSKDEFTGVRNYISKFRKDLKSKIMNYNIQFIDYNWRLNK